MCGNKLGVVSCEELQEPTSELANRKASRLSRTYYLVNREVGNTIHPIVIRANAGLVPGIPVDWLVSFLAFDSEAEISEDGALDWSDMSVSRQL